MTCDPSRLIQVTVAIPDEVVEFMEYVWELIDVNDETVMRESDDGIQHLSIAPIVGGLGNKSAKQYEFTYRPDGYPPEGPTTGPVWDLMLFENEIEDIAKCNVRDLRLWKCPNDGCQNHFTFKRHHYCSCPE